MTTSTLHLNNPVPSNGAVVSSLGGRHTVTVTLAGVGAISCVVQAWGSEQGTDSRKIGAPVTVSGTTTVSQTLTFDADCKQFWLELVSLSPACKFNATVENDGSTSLAGPLRVAGGVSAYNLQGGAPGRRAAILGNSIGRAGYNPADPAGTSQWFANTAVTVGARRFFNHFDLRAGHFVPRYATCTAAGTTGATEPRWGDVGATHVDGTAEWIVTAQTGVVNLLGGGWWRFAQWMAGNPLIETYLVGFASAQSDVILAYLTDDVIDAVDVVIFSNLWENDALNGNATIAAARWAAFETLADSLRARGKVVGVQTVLPMSNLDWDGYAYTRGNDSIVWEWLNRKIREYAAARRDVVFCDVARAYPNLNPALPVWPDQATLYTQGDMTTDLVISATDRVHPETLGHFLIAKMWAPVLEARFGRREVFGVAKEANQLDPNPLLYGTTGPLGTNTTGVVAANKTVSCNAVASAVCSKIAGDGCAPIRVVITSDQQGAFAYLGSSSDVSLAGSGFAVGDIVQLFVAIKIKANPVGFAVPRIQLQFVGSTGVTQINGLPYAASHGMIGQVITEDTSMVLSTVPIKIPPGTTAVKLRSEMYCSGSAGVPVNTTIEFERVGISRPVTPAIA